LFDVEVVDVHLIKRLVLYEWKNELTRAFHPFSKNCPTSASPKDLKKASFANQLCALSRALAFCSDTISFHVAQKFLCFIRISTKERSFKVRAR